MLPEGQGSTKDNKNFNALTCPTFHHFKFFTHEQMKKSNAEIRLSITLLY